MVITYNGDGQVSRVEDKVAGHTTEYEYDGAGRLIRAYRADADGAPLLQAENLYDAYGRAKSSTYVMPNQTQNYTLTYRNKSSLLSTISLPDPTGTAKISYSYDAFDRISYMFLNSMNVPDIQTTFQYVDRVNGSATYTSSRIAKETLTTENASSLTYAYTYDANGNITEIKRNNSSYLLYEYDSLGQLTRESSYTTLTYDRYAYDGSGNRVSKNTYYWSGTLKSGETYGYTNSTWGDLLTNYDGTTISYDASGNPTKWKNASNLYWTGNRLTLVSLEGANAEEAFFSYNSEGIRTKKRFAGGAGSLPYYTDVYTVDGSRILSEKRMVNNIVRNTIYYVYDANGAVIGMEYNGTKYWYDKNLQGDVVGIRNASGTLVAQYVYDAWGNHRQITDGSGNDVSDNPAHIANINPFRYRGYYYDTETGWYYLNTRYYDPNVGRFLSPDTILGANGGLLGYNLYAYCNNNPVMFVDPSGMCYYRNEYMPGYYNIEDIPCWNPLPDYIVNPDDPSKLVLCEHAQNLAGFIKGWETFSETFVPAIESDENESIGYGYTIKAGANDELIKRATGTYRPSSITVEQADYLFWLSMAHGVNPKLKRGAASVGCDLPPRYTHEYNALLSVTYNSSRKYIELISDLNNGMNPMEAFKKTAIGNVFYSGILKRRIAEANIYISGIYNSSH